VFIERGVQMSTFQEGGIRSGNGARRNIRADTMITVVTVTYNAAQYLPDTIMAIRAQTYPNIEWIVIDGGSTDGTVDILKANESVIDYWVSEPDRGMYDAIAKGFERANGEILCWLNAGDIFMPGALCLVAELFDKYPSVNWLTGMQFTHLPGGKLVGCFIPLMYSSDLIKCGVYGNKLPFIQQESTFFRRSLMSTVDLEKFRSFKLAGDLFLWNCFAVRDSLVVVCAGLGSFCIHEGQLSENLALYWIEASTFLKPMTLLVRIKTGLQQVAQYLPMRLKKAVAGNNFLRWQKI